MGKGFLASRRGLICSNKIGSRGIKESRILMNTEHTGVVLLLFPAPSCCSGFISFLDFGVRAVPEGQGPKFVRVFLVSTCSLNP